MKDFLKSSKAITEEDILRVSAEIIAENKKIRLSQEFLDIIFPECLGTTVYPKLIDNKPYFFGIFENDKKGLISELEILDASKRWLLEKGFFFTLNISNDRCACSCNNMIPIVRVSEYEAILSLITEILFNEKEFLNSFTLNESILGERIFHLSKDWKEKLTESEKREIRNFLDKVGID